MFKPAHQLVLEAKQSVQEIPAAALDRLAGEEVLLIDVREPDEYQQGHLAGAISIPRGLLEFKISADPALQNLTRPIIVYCKTSGRAALSALALQAMGFGHVLSLAGGFDAWVAENRPVVPPEKIAYE